MKYNSHVPMTVAINADYACLQVYILLAHPIHSSRMSQAPRKQEKDYSAEVKALQPQVEEIAKVSYRH